MGRLDRDTFIELEDDGCSFSCRASSTTAGSGPLNPTPIVSDFPLLNAPSPCWVRVGRGRVPPLVSIGEEGWGCYHNNRKG